MGGGGWSLQDYGNSENSVAAHNKSQGAGTMEAIYFGNANVRPCADTRVEVRCTVVDNGRVHATVARQPGRRADETQPQRAAAAHAPMCRRPRRYSLRQREG